jgi:hypothetical protein
VLCAQRISKKTPCMPIQFLAAPTVLDLHHWTGLDELPRRPRPHNNGVKEHLLSTFGTYFTVDAGKDEDGNKCRVCRRD